MDLFLTPLVWVRSRVRLCVCRNALFCFHLLWIGNGYLPLIYGCSQRSECDVRLVALESRGRCFVQQLHGYGNMVRGEFRGELDATWRPRGANRAGSTAKALHQFQFN